MTLGQLLKSKRNENGRSLEQVAASTKIHIKILTAIEDDQYSELPARTFTRGFIVNYAKALKLDPDQLLKDHQEYLEQKFSERPNRDQGHQGYAFEGKELEQNRRWMVIGASIAVIFAVAVLLLFKPQNHKHKEMNKEFEEESSEIANDANVNDVGAVTTPALIASPSLTPIVNSSNGGISPVLVTGNQNSTLDPLALAKPNLAPSISATPVKATSTPTSTTTATPTSIPTATPASTPSPIPSATPAFTLKADKLNKGDDLEKKEVKRKVTFEAKEDVWVRYRSDDRPANTIILRKGRFLVIKAKETLIFETNRPEAVSYKTNGQYGPLNLSKGEVTESGAKAYDGTGLGSTQLPDEVPASPLH